MIGIRFVLLLCCLCAGCSAASPRNVIVLIGGSSSERDGRHQYADGVARLARWVEASDPGLRARAFPGGWPDDPGAFDDAAAVVLYFDGDDRHPLLDAGRRDRFAALARRGIGIVALHQASTVPVGGRLRLDQWLGVERRGLFDRTTETVAAQVDRSHPVGLGVEGLTYRDEFYPTLHALAGASPVPVVTATLHPQFRDGQMLVEAQAEQATVGWAFERADGGRSFTYTGMHFSAAFDEPGLQRLIVNAIAWVSRRSPPSRGPLEDDEAGRPAAVAAQSVAAIPDVRDVTAFLGNAARNGWYRHEAALSPDRVGDGLNLVWESPPLASDATGQPPRLYASPLYVERVRISDGPHQGQTHAVVIAATSNGDIYAINAARNGDVAAGRILWTKHLGEPCRLQPAPLDGVPTGILSTPVIDVARGRLYATHCDPRSRWQAYALDLGSGRVLPGWPVRLDEPALNRVNRNAGSHPVVPSRKHDFRVQRGALALSHDSRWLHVVFGETETGWLVAVDTRDARIASAFASVAMPRRSSGGIWGAGGPAVDDDGSVFIVTGTGYDGYADRVDDWTQSVLKLQVDGDGRLRLEGTYTPFNHCMLARMDIDLGSGGASLLPVPAGQAAATRLAVVGGKQGNVYLLDRERLPGGLRSRPPCSSDAASDASLLPPGRQPQFGTRGPLNVFGPYSESDAALDLARSRSVPASMVDGDGRIHVFATGTSKRAEGVADSVPPSLVRLEVVDREGEGEEPYLRIAARADAIAMRNPGSAVVSGTGLDDAVVWVLDENAPRSAALSGPAAPRPVLYAFDARDLRLLWRSPPGLLSTSGKYNAPAIARGQVIVGTDRIQAFGFGVAVREAPAQTEPSATHVESASVMTPNAGAAPSGAGIDGAAIYRSRCAVCHDHPTGNVPPRAVIASRGRERILSALSGGVMQPFARGLSMDEIAAVAEHLE